MSSLTYDQRSEIRIAFDEAFVEAERRRDPRIRHVVGAEVREWKKGKEGLPFTLSIEDFAPGGVGAVHGTPLRVGSQFLIRIPRQKWGDLTVLMTVNRCKQADDGRFHIGMEISTVMDQPVMGRYVDALAQHTYPPRWLKVAFLAFGICGIAVTLMIN